MVCATDASPGEALARLARGESFDLAVLDMHMPGMDGVALARRMRERGAAMPLVLFSSLGRREVGEGEALFAAYLAKPCGSRSSSTCWRDCSLDGRCRSPRAPPATLRLERDMAVRHPLRILLAEDNVVNQKLALRILQQMGYRRTSRRTAWRPSNRWQRQVYDVVLMDVQMPEMDGLDAARAIAPLGTQERPRIVAMTANAMQGDRDMCFAAGMDDYLTKPIRVERLVEVLNQVSRRVAH
jgi:CheY-like chemotaxis protein